MRAMFLCVCAAAIGQLAPAGSASALGTYSNEAIGFRLSVPSDYKEVPPQATEPFIVARFLSNKSQFGSDPVTGNTLEYNPTIQVIAFLDVMIEGEEEEVEGEDGSDNSVSWSPYPDYEAYLKERAVGFYLLTDPEQGEESGMPVVKMEVSVNNGDIRYMTWVYTLEVGKVAVQVSMLDSHYDKAKRDALKVLKSLAPIPRTKDLSTITGRAKFVSFFFLDKLDPEERKLRLQDMEREAWQRVTSELPDGWKTLEHKGVQIVTHADERHAKEVAEHVSGVRRWLETTFAEVGQGAYTRTPIVRICESPDEENTFRQGLPDFFGSINEIVTHKSTSGATSGEWNYVNQQTLSRWFGERDSSTWVALPPWLRFGLTELVGTAKPKGNKLEFPERDFERTIRRLAKEGQITPCRDLIAMPEEKFIGNGEDVYARIGEAFALTRFLLTGSASRSAATKDFFPLYMKNLGAVVDEVEKEERERIEKEGRKEPKNEEEEAALQREQRDRFLESRERILKEAASRTFGTWKDQDWARFESEYLKNF